MEFAVVIVVSALLTGWLVLWRVAKVFGRPLGEIFDDLFRPDLDRIPLSARAINRKYRKLIQKSGQPGPAGLIQPRKHVVVSTPAEDYAFIQSFGIVDFENQLLSYVRSYASEMGWSASETSDPSTIHFARDEQRKRLRPSLKLSGLPEKATEFLQPPTPARSSAPPAPEPREAMSDATAPYTPGPPAASLTYRGLQTELPPAAGELTVGRKENNDIVVDHPHYSSRHLIVWPQGGRWHVKVSTDNKNDTYLNGQVLRETTVLSDGDRITVGASTPLIFRSQ